MTADNQPMTPEEPQPGAVYAELHEPDAATCGLGAVWNRHSMRDFADRTHALRKQAEEGHIKLLAECRCAFPVPEPGSPLEVHWAAAMACPEEVPEYVRMCVALMQAAPKAAPVQSGLVATMLDALRHAQKVLNHNNLHLACGPVNAAILAARAPAESVQGDALDAGRWRRLVNASELSFPVATIADDPENGAVMLYGRKALEDFVDRMDEIPNTYDAARAAQEDKSHDN